MRKPKKVIEVNYLGIKKRRDEKAEPKKKEKLMLILTILACVGGIIVIMIGLEWGIERLFNYSTPTNWQDSDWQDLSSYWQDSSSYWRTQYNLLKAQQELSEYHTDAHPQRRRIKSLYFYRMYEPHEEWELGWKTP